MPVIVITAVLVVANLGALVVLLRLLAGLRRRLADLAEHAGRLEERAEVVTPDVSRALASTKKKVIVVELLDPIGLATRRMSIAGPVGGLAPRAIERVVHDQTVKTLREVLVTYGVDADVQMYAA